MLSFGEKVAIYIISQPVPVRAYKAIFDCRSMSPSKLLKKNIMTQVETANYELSTVQGR